MYLVLSYVFLCYLMKFLNWDLKGSINENKLMNADWVGSSVRSLYIFMLKLCEEAILPPDLMQRQSMLPLCGLQRLSNQHMKID